jgi:hypothetical protein
MICVSENPRRRKGSVSRTHSKSHGNRLPRPYAFTILVMEAYIFRASRVCLVALANAAGR